MRFISCFIQKFALDLIKKDFLKFKKRLIIKHFFQELYPPKKNLMSLQQLQRLNEEKCHTSFEKYKKRNHFSKNFLGVFKIYLD